MFDCSRLSTKTEVFRRYTGILKFRWVLDIKSNEFLLRIRTSFSNDTELVLDVYLLGFHSFLWAMNFNLFHLCKIGFGMCFILSHLTNYLCLCRLNNNCERMRASLSAYGRLKKNRIKSSMMHLEQFCKLIASLCELLCQYMVDPKNRIKSSIMYLEQFC